MHKALSGTGLGPNSHPYLQLSLEDHALRQTEARQNKLMLAVFAAFLAVIATAWELGL